MDKFQENLHEAIRHMQIADHMAYVTYPLIKDKRLLLKIFEETYFSIINCINAILEYEAKLRDRRIENTEIFFQKYSKYYNLTEDNVKKIQEILEMNKRHKKSAMEFVRNDKIVILSNSLGTKTLDIQLIKSYLLTAKELLLKINQKIGKMNDIR